MLAVASCSGDGKPDDLLDHESMVSYLIDLHVAEAEITNLRVELDSASYLFSILEEDLLVKHEITEAGFIDSYNYYLQHPDELQLIYTTVVDSLSLRQSLRK